MAKRTMAKRTHASARGKRASKKSANIPEKTARKTTPQKTARKTAAHNTRRKTLASQTKNANLASRYVYTPEWLAYARHCYEHSAASIARIAVDLGVHKKTLRKLADCGSWLRYVRPARGLPRAVRLKAHASELESRVLGAAAATSAPASESGTDLPRAGGGDAMLPLSDTVERLYRAVLEELAGVENLRAQLKREPQSPQDAERTARTLSSLTETLQKLQRLQCAVPQSGSCDDDMPADIDEFRTELARRIEAFVASRPDPGDGGGAIPASLDAAAR